MGVIFDSSSYLSILYSRQNIPLELIAGYILA